MIVSIATTCTCTGSCMVHAAHKTGIINYMVKFSVRYLLQEGVSSVSAVNLFLYRVHFGVQKLRFFNFK